MRPPPIRTHFLLPPTMTRLPPQQLIILLLPPPLLSIFHLLPPPLNSPLLLPPPPPSLSIFLLYLLHLLVTILLHFLSLSTHLLPPVIILQQVPTDNSHLLPPLTSFHLLQTRHQFPSLRIFLLNKIHPSPTNTQFPQTILQPNIFLPTSFPLQSTCNIPNPPQHARHYSNMHATHMCLLWIGTKLELNSKHKACVKCGSTSKKCTVLQYHYS